MDSLSTRLKQRRKELGYTLLQIAEYVGVSEATVQRWESGNIKSLRHRKTPKSLKSLDFLDFGVFAFYVVKYCKI